MISRLKLLLTGTLRSSGDFEGRAGRGLGRVGSMYGFPKKTSVCLLPYCTIRILKLQIQRFQPPLGLGHQGIFGRFVGRFIGY